MSLSDLLPTDLDLMPVEVFIGGNGDIVLLQEHPDLIKGDRFSRVLIRRRDAEAIASAIIAAVGKGSAA